MPLSVKTPVPSLVRLSVLLPFWIVPENVVDVLSPPVVSVAGNVAPLLVTVPDPVSEPMVWLKPPRSSVPGAFTVIRLVAPNTLVVLPAVSTPPDMTQGVVATGRSRESGSRLLVPVLLKTPKPWYCAALSAPPLPDPPSVKVSAALNAATLPEMLDPGSSVRLLTPPVKVIALARVTPSPAKPPAIDPLLVMVTLLPDTPTPPSPTLAGVPDDPPFPPRMVAVFVSVPPDA